MNSPQYITDNKGKKVSVILPIKQYEKMLEELEDAEDLRFYEEAKKDDDGSYVTLEQYVEKRKAKKK